MANNINQYGYEKIRSFILGSWKYLELRKPDGTVLKRFGTADGLSMSIVGNEIEYKIVVSGADAVFQNQSVGKSVIFDSDVSANAIATESFTIFTFADNADELTVLHRLQVPTVI